MFPFAWATDIHLDHVKDSTAFVEQLRNCPEPLILITGDITTARGFEGDLRRLAACGKPIAFVLGNHDMWGQSVAGADQQARTLTDAAMMTDIVGLMYLPAVAPLVFMDGSYLLGVNGYADGRAGSLDRSTVWLNDYDVCHDFKGTRSNAKLLKDTLRALGQASAHQLYDQMAKVPRTAKRIVIATHAPPFREAHWFEDKPGDDHWSPHFVNVTLGEQIRWFANERPDCEFVVVCGHTHWGTHAELTPNLSCFVGWATYGSPQIQDPGALPTRWPIKSRG